MKKAFHFFSHIFGFEKLSNHEKDYLHDSNTRSSIYMGVIVICLEIWMIIRQTLTKIIPKHQAGEALFGLFIKYTTKYWLFLLIALALLLFCLFYHRSKILTRGRFIALVSVGSACILYTAVLKLEPFTQESESITPVMAFIMNAMLVSIYVLITKTDEQLKEMIDEIKSRY